MPIPEAGVRTRRIPTGGLPTSAAVTGGTGPARKGVGGRRRESLSRNPGAAARAYSKENCFRLPCEMS